MTKTRFSACLVVAPDCSHWPQSAAPMHKRRPVSSRPCEWPTIRWKRNNNFIGRKNRLRRTISTSLKQQLLPEREAAHVWPRACVLAGDGLGSLTAEDKARVEQIYKPVDELEATQSPLQEKETQMGYLRGRRRGRRRELSNQLAQCERERDTRTPSSRSSAESSTTRLDHISLATRLATEPLFSGAGAPFSSRLAA
jgi:hypothetical protein